MILLIQNDSFCDFFIKAIFSVYSLNKLDLDEISEGHSGKLLGFCLTGGTFSNLWFSFLLLFSSSFCTILPILIYSVCPFFHHWLDVSLSSVLLLCPFNQQTSSNHRRLNQHLLSLSLHPYCFLFIHTHLSLHSFFLMFISSPILSSIPCCLLFFQILLKFTQKVEDTSGCSVYTSSLERQQETQDLMNVLCRGKTAISCLRLSLVSLHHMLPSTAPSLNFHNGFLCR